MDGEWRGTNSEGWWSFTGRAVHIRYFLGFLYSGHGERCEVIWCSHQGILLHFLLFSPLLNVVSLLTDGANMIHVASFSEKGIMYMTIESNVLCFFLFVQLIFPTGDVARPFSMLGLGDIVIPGLPLAIYLNFVSTRVNGLTCAYTLVLNREN